jgi:hypothetical protein
VKGGVRLRGRFRQCAVIDARLTNEIISPMAAVFSPWHVQGSATDIFIVFAYFNGR